MYLKSGVLAFKVHEETFFKNICKDVIEYCRFSRTETNVGIEAHKSQSIVIYHVSKWDGSNMEKDF